MTREGRPVTIELVTVHRADEVEERQVQRHQGSRHEGNGKIYLRFKESLIEGEKPVLTMIILEGTQMRLHRKGPYGAKLQLEAGHKQRTNYVTPMGAMDIVLETHQLDLFISDERIEIETRYNIYSQDMLLNTVEMIIRAF